MANSGSNQTDPAFLTKAHSRLVSFDGCEIWFHDGYVVVDSQRPIADLVLREFARPRIYFQSACYYACQKSQSSSPPVVHRYVLAPWPKNDEAATREIVLNAEYFRQLTADRHRDLLENAAFKLLVAFYPFLGYLWSPQKRTLIRIGFEPQSISSVSIYVGFMVALVSGALQVILMFGAKSFSPDLMMIALIFGIDAMGRYNRLLMGRDAIPPGFYEWLLRRRDITG